MELWRLGKLFGMLVVIVANVVFGIHMVNNLVQRFIDLFVIVVSEVFEKDLELLTASVQQRMIRSLFSLFLVEFHDVNNSFIACNIN